MALNKISNHLEDRSRLTFEFFQGNNKIIRILNFFENIEIRESQKANLVEYNPLSRAGSLFSYTGATSRELEITFNLTLPNIIAASNRNYKPYQGKKSKEEQQRKFFDDVLADTKSPLTFLSTAHSTNDYDFLYKNYLLDRDERKEIQKYITEKDSPLYDAFSERHKAIDTIIFWTNLIRTSVVNNVRNPLDGPPIVRLAHGTMYRDVPCICTNYSITSLDSAGYDNRTLLPRVITVTMILREVRTGDFTEHRIAVPIKRDNLTGWESIVDQTKGSMDPGEVNMSARIIPDFLFKLLGNDTIK